MVLRGLFLDPRTWKIDYLASPFWNPEKFGIEIDLHPDAFNIPSQGLKKKYDFVIHCFDFDRFCLPAQWLFFIFG